METARQHRIKRKATSEILHRDAKSLAEVKTRGGGWLSEGSTERFLRVFSPDLGAAVFYIPVRDIPETRCLSHVAIAEARSVPA